MVNGVVYRPAIGREVGVAGDLRPGRDLALDPALERLGGGDLARDLEPVDDRLLVVSLLVGEVVEVERGLDPGSSESNHIRPTERERGMFGVMQMTVLRHRVAEPFGVEREGQLVGVVHQVGPRRRCPAG